MRQALAQQQGADVWVAQAQEEWGLYEFELAAGQACCCRNAASGGLPERMQGKAALRPQRRGAGCTGNPLFCVFAPTPCRPCPWQGSAGAGAP